ncbi:MAG: oligosaccharide flippase family protein [archaeon]
MSEAKTFAKNTLFNYLSKIIPAGASFIFTLIISNYLGPANYGIYNYLPAVFVGFVTLFGGDFLSNLLWTFTAREKSIDLFKKILLIQLGIVATFFVAVNIFGPAIMRLIGVSYEELVPIASIFLLLTPVNTIFMTLFKGFSRFGKVLKAALIENITTLALSVILIIFLGFGLTGAFIARFAAIIASTAYYYIQLKQIKFSAKKIDLAAIKKFCVWNAAASFVRESSNQIYTISIGIFINAQTLGLYYLGDKIAGTIMNSPSNAITETIFSKNSGDYKNKKLIGRQTSLAIKTSLVISIIIGALLLFFAPLLLSIAFPKYLGLLYFLPLIIIYQAVQVQSPMTTVFNSINETKNNFKLNSLFLFLTIIFVVPSTFAFGITGFLVSTIIATELRYIATILILRKEGVYLSILPGKSDLLFMFNFLRDRLKSK